MEILCYLNEIWKDIKGYEGIYQVSNFGRVKSLNYNKTGKEHILKLTKRHNGYLQVNLSKNGKIKNYSVHRLVWEAFNGPIPEGMQINHKSEVKTENNLENLELMTHKENSNYGTRNERVSEKQINDKTKSKCVLQYSLDGCLVKEWPSLMEIERQLGYNHTNISSCCLNKYEKMYGYIWKYQ